MEFPAHLNWLKSDPLSSINQRKRSILAEGRELIDLSMINPDILPATSVIDKLHEFSIKPYNHRYAVSRGIRKLREAFSKKYESRFAVSLDPESQVCIAQGTKDAVHSVLSALTKAGDCVLIGRPAYPAYLSSLKLARLHAAFFEISRDEASMLRDINDALKRTGAKVLLLNFPNNPTGVTVSEDFYVKLYEIVTRHEAFVVNDFVYGEMGYFESPVSILSIRGFEATAVETYSLSKAYSIPGWRVGAILGNRTVVEEVSRMKSHSEYGIFLPIQLAAASILTGKQDVVTPIVGQYQKRLRVLMRGLSSLGWEFDEPRAGASLWVRIPEPLRHQGAIAFCEDILEKKGVLFSPGNLYGAPYNDMIRIALVASEEKMHTVAEGLRDLFAHGNRETVSCAQGMKVSV